jgi:LPXTG-motif cell wall-anchored protein
MSYTPPSRRVPPRGGIIGSAIAGVLVLVGIVFAALSCSSPSSPAATGPTTTVIPVTVSVLPAPATVTVVPPPTVVYTTVYVPPKSVNSGSGGAADPDNGLDTGTVVLLLGGALLVVGGGIALVRRRRVS